jgi:hypothetical protein
MSMRRTAAMGHKTPPRRSKYSPSHKKRRISLTIRLKYSIGDKDKWSEWLIAAFVGTSTTATFTAVTTFTSGVGQRGGAPNTRVDLKIVFVITAALAGILVFALAIFFYSKLASRRRELAKDRLGHPDLRAVRTFVDHELQLLSMLTKDSVGE